MIDTLDRLDLLELPGQCPWRETGPDDDAFPVDWEQVEAPIDDRRGLGPVLDEDSAGWDRVEDWLREKVRPRGGHHPP